MPKPLEPKGLAFTRRQFLKTSALAAGAAAAGVRAYGGAGASTSKLNLAVIGVGGKGADDAKNCAMENIVALCDVDQAMLDKVGKLYPGAKLFKDYRKMFDEMKEIEGVIVATPDHHHALASIAAMEHGKHVYCQKPLAYSIYEARKMREVAARTKVVTQMGNQGSAENGLRRGVELIQAGAIGKVKEVHVWSNRPIWPQGMDRPAGSDPVPEGLDWDSYLGPAPLRPFKKDAYHLFKWRGYQDFGTGALGDMACHTANLPFRGLKLGYPTSIEAESTGINKESYPESSKICFEFPVRAGMPPVSFWWYDGGAHPPEELTEHVLDFMATQKDRSGKPRERKLPISGCLLIGDKGHLFSPDDYGTQCHLLPGKDFTDYKDPAQTIPRITGGHYKEWLDACKGNGKIPYSNFEVAAYLTEIILLGCVALRTGKKLEWDGPGMRATNAPEAAQYVKREFRKGWEV